MVVVIFRGLTLLFFSLRPTRSSVPDIPFSSISCFATCFMWSRRSSDTWWDVHFSELFMWFVILVAGGTVELLSYVKYSSKVETIGIAN